MTVARKWTDEEVRQLRAMAKAKRTQREMAAALGRTTASVQGRIKKLKIRLGRWIPPETHAWRRYKTEVRP